METIGSIVEAGRAIHLRCGVVLVIVAFLHRHEIARQTEGEVGVADVLHLFQQAVHDAVSLFVIDQPVSDGHPVDEGEPIVMKFAIGALPTGKHPGFRIEKGRDVGRAQLGGLGGVGIGVGRVAELPCELGKHEAGPIRQGIRVGILMAEIDGVPPVGRAGGGRRAGAEVAAGRILDQAVAILVGGHHFARPGGQLGIVVAAPRLVLAAVHIGACG